MEFLKTYKTQMLRLAFLLAVLFALAPCTVKSSVYFSIGIEFSSPSNKTKTTVQKTCAVESGTLISASKAHSPQQPAMATIPHQTISATAAASFTQQREVDEIALHVSSSPPLYILFKQMKTDSVAV